VTVKVDQRLSQPRRRRAVVADDCPLHFLRRETVSLRQRDAFAVARTGSATPRGRIARERGALVAYDPKLAPVHLARLSQSLAIIWQMMQMPDVVKLADEEWEIVTGTASLKWRPGAFLIPARAFSSSRADKSASFLHARCVRRR
jgi:hypothetical protein